MFVFFSFILIVDEKKVRNDTIYIVFFIPGRGRRESTLTDANRRSLKQQELRHETAASFSSSLPWASGTAPGSRYNLLGIPRYPWVSCAAVKDRTRRPREREREKTGSARTDGKVRKEKSKKKNNNVHCDTSKQPRMRVLQERATQAGVHADQTQT